MQFSIQKDIRVKTYSTRKMMGNMYHSGLAGTYAARDKRLVFLHLPCSYPCRVKILSSAARSVRCQSEHFEKGQTTSFSNTSLIIEEAFASVLIITYFLTDFVNILYNYGRAANLCRMHQKGFTLIVRCYSAQQQKNGLP